MPQPEGRLPQVVKKKEGHMPELRKRRSHLALLGVFAMAASVLAVGAPSAMAEPGKAEAAATYSACVGPATVDAGFTDVATGSTHDAAINCIAYYGITKGTTATTFAPNQTISRWQLAVMLQRAAGPAGVTLPDASNQGYTDISGMSSAFQDAINQMGALGIMAGTTASTFDPSGIVSRAVIVEALAGFLTSAQVGPGGKPLTRNVNQVLSLKDRTGNNAMDISIDESFRDIGGVTYSANQAIRALAEMGVVQGRSDGTFGPAASVTRAQAAAFITRALAHTNTRPAGLTMQSATANGATTAVDSETQFDLVISIRGDDFAPIQNAEVDVFRYAARNAASAFKQDGTCNSGTGGVESSGLGSSACTIELDDHVTEPDGNIESPQGEISENTMFWAWTADVGTTLDWDVTPGLSRDNSDVSNSASVTMTTVTRAASAKVTTSVSPDAEEAKTVRYGTTVTVTIQLVDANGNDIGIPGQIYSWFATGVHNPLTSVIPGTGSRTVITDSTGKATFTLTQADPDTNKDRDVGNEDPGANDVTTWTYRIAAAGNAVPVAPNTMIDFTVVSGQGTGQIIFDDDPSRATKVTATLQRAWTQIPTSGTARVAVTGKVTDQYGFPLRGHDIYFDLDGLPGFGCDPDPSDGCSAEDFTIDPDNGDSIVGTQKRTTRSNGTVTLTTSWSETKGRSGMGETDRQEARYLVAADFTGPSGTGDPDNIITAGAGELADVRHFWAAEPAGWNADSGTGTPTLPASGAGIGHGDLKVVDLQRNALIMRSSWPSGDNYRVYRYDDSTIFRWFIGANPEVSGDADAAAPDQNSNPLVRWLTTEEFEARMTKQLDRVGAMTVGMGNTESSLGIRQYNTKSGTTILSIKLNGTTDAARNEGLIYDPPAG